MSSSIESKMGITIRLTDERWSHIVEEHAEMTGLRNEILETIRNPERIFIGNESERLAVREQSSGKYLVAIYREDENDGFLITAFMTRRINTLERKQLLWP